MGARGNVYNDFLPHHFVMVGIAFYAVRDVTQEASTVTNFVDDMPGRCGRTASLLCLGESLLWDDGFVGGGEWG